MKYVIKDTDLQEAYKIIEKFEKSKEVPKDRDNTFSFISNTDLKKMMSLQEDNELFCHALSRMVEKYKNNYDKLKDFADYVNIHVKVLEKYRNGIRKTHRKDLFKIIIGLKCNQNDAMFLMEKAGFSFDKSNNRDLVVLCHILAQEFDRANIDENLLQEGESPLFEYK